MANEYIKKQVTILLLKSMVQSSDGSWHKSSDIIYYEQHRPVLTAKQRYLRALYIGKAFFTNDFINWYSTAESLINSIKNKSSK
ncbi:MAG: hypothetical protein CFE24_15100 [Flavobacterium sp. BFFFF2]|nr:MAG: hypothetical protein CFE24_15100 [Flavobacterium sp. BFFFF2]